MLFLIFIFYFHTVVHFAGLIWLNTSSLHSFLLSLLEVCFFTSCYPMSPSQLIREIEVRVSIPPRFDLCLCLSCSSKSEPFERSEEKSVFANHFFSWRILGILRGICKKGFIKSILARRDSNRGLLERLSKMVTIRPRHFPLYLWLYFGRLKI